MQPPGTTGTHLDNEDWRYASLLEVMDLVAMHNGVEGILPDLARCLKKVVDFDAMDLVLTWDGGKSAVPYHVTAAQSEDGGVEVSVESVPLPPVVETGLASFWSAGKPVVLHSLEDGSEYPELVERMRDAGERSLCLLPLATALRPVGLVAFASSRTGAYDHADLVFLQRVATQVATAIDNVRHFQEAAAYERQLEAERDHWRTLLEINNALVTNLDLASLLAAITPTLHRIVEHDYTSLSLLAEDGRAMALSAPIPLCRTGWISS
jgi:formate hydrogenlyase transcriptional activator